MMRDEKSRNDSVTPTSDDAAQEATSNQTVADLKKNDEASATSTGDSTGSAEGSSTPSPDGQFDGPRDGSGIGEETGPM